MGMRMSETGPAPKTGHSALAHASEVAQWVLLLLGWLWLGEQGMRLGWSVASGVLAVSLWWAARLLCRGSHWALRASPTMMAVCGGLSALGVWLPEALAAWNLAHLGLLAVALMWGAWSGLVETRSRVSTFDLAPVAWHPVLAAAAVSWMGWAPVDAISAAVSTSVFLAVCAAVLHARDLATADTLRVCRGQRAGLSHVLAPSAMGLMMGSLWLGNVWCAGLGWTTQEMVLGHLAMMAVLPTLVALAGRMLSSAAMASSAASGMVWAMIFTPHSGPLPQRVGQAHGGVARPRFRPLLSLALLALGALMLLGQSTAYNLLAMLLPSLAWAVHCSRPRMALVFSGGASAWLMRCMALVLGPGLLLWVGMASPAHGPLAMQTALALLGALAAVQALVLRAHTPVAYTAWSTP